MTDKEDTVASTPDKEDARAATHRADHERRNRLVLIDKINAVLAAPHADVDTLKAHIKAALDGDQ